MSTVLDSGALTAVARSPHRLRALHYRDLGEVVVPCTVLVESLTGDHRRDHHTNWFLKGCRIVVVDEPIARRAALLRTAARHPTASATDATVVAVAHAMGADVILTSDAGDLGAIAGASSVPVRVVAI